MRTFSSICILGLVALANSAPAENDKGLEAYLKECKGVSGLENIYKCVGGLVDKVAASLKHPSPLLNLPSVDPGQADDIHIHSENADIKLDAKFTEVIFKGLSDINLRNVSVDYKRKIARGEAEFPTARLQGRYELTADLKPLVLNGKGTFWMDFSGIEGSVDIPFEVREIDGVPRVQILKPILNTQIPEGLTFRFNNLINGDAVLDNAANRILYENRYQLADLLYNDVTDAVAKFGQKLANTALRSIDVEDMAGYEELKKAFNI